jgi:PAS domain S-box-containing protein
MLERVRGSLQGYAFPAIAWTNLASEMHSDAEPVAAAQQQAQIDPRATIDALPTLHWRTKPDGVVEFINKTWLEYTGFSVEQALGWGWTRAVHPDDQQSLGRIWTSLLASGHPGEAEARLRQHDGQYRWFLFLARPLKDQSGQVVAWLGTSIDIDDRRFAESLLSGENLILEATAEGAPLNSILEQLCGHADEFSGNSGTSVWLLDQSENLLRYAASANLPSSFLEKVSSISVGPEEGACGASVSRGEPVCTPDISSYPPEVSYRDACLSHGLCACWSTPIVSSASGTLGTFTTFCNRKGNPSARDLRVIQQITHLASIAIERSRTEDALRRTRDELAHVTRVTTLGELAASIAHEMNQPLSAIGTHGDAGLRWLARESPAVERARDTFKRIIDTARRASEVLQRIRDLSRKTSAEAAVIDINAIITDSVLLVQSEITRQKSAVRLDMEAELPAARGDRVQLQQVLINLLMNATEAMENVADHPRELVVRSQSCDVDLILVSVRDTGVGIDLANGDRMFKAFFTTKRTGMGMGLSICRAILEAHGGRIWAVRNVDGPGSTFNFVVPVAREVEP